MKGKSELITKYKASGALVVSGGFKNIVQAKSYHGLLVLAQMNNWKYDARGEMRISLYELHKLTRQSCKNWQEYLDVLKKIKNEIELDWEYLSYTVGGFNRVGKVNILSEVRADKDLAGNFKEIVFRIPAALLEDVIRPKWYGQVNPEILFSIKSNYAFNAYLFASLTVIEKDKTKDIFWSDARTIEDWANIFGSEKTPAWRFKNNIFKRISAHISKTTKNTDEPISIEFTDEHCSKGLYQMKVTRLKRLQSEEKQKSQREQIEALIREKREKEEKQISEEQKNIEKWVESHPEKEKILTELRKQFPKTPEPTYFSLVAIGYCPDC